MYLCIVPKCIGSSDSCPRQKIWFRTCTTERPIFARVPPCRIRARAEGERAGPCTRASGWCSSDSDSEELGVRAPRCDGGRHACITRRRSHRWLPAEDRGTPRPLQGRGVLGRRAWRAWPAWPVSRERAAAGQVQAAGYRACCSAVFRPRYVREPRLLHLRSSQQPSSSGGGTRGSRCGRPDKRSSNRSGRGSASFRRPTTSASRCLPAHTCRRHPSRFPRRAGRREVLAMQHKPVVLVHWTHMSRVVTHPNRDAAPR